MHARGRGRGAALRSSDAVLQRASSALRGDRPSSRGSGDDEEVGIGAYLSALSRQTNTKQYKWDEMLDMSDKSDDDMMLKPSKAAASKFLKKKPQKEETQTSVDPPKSSTTEPSKSRSFNKFSSQNKGKNISALSKAAAYSDSFKSKRKEVVKFSDSDLDMDLSVDSEVASELNIPKPTSELRAAKVQANKPVPKPRRAPPSPQSSSDSEFGKTGSKFIRKAASVRPESPEEEVLEVQSQPNAPKPSMFRLMSAEHFSQEKALDSDEESLQEFIQGLSASSDGDLTARTPRSPATPQGNTTPRRRVKPMSPPPHRSPTPLEDISERDEMGEESRTDSSSDGPVFKLMDLDALEPVALPEPKKKQKKTQSTGRSNQPKVPAKKQQVERKKSVEFFQDLGLHTVDELLGPASDVVSDVESVASEVRSDADLPPSPSPAPLKGILSTPRTPRSPRRVRLSLTDVRSRSPSPEAISTARASASIVYTDDFDDPSRSEAAASIRTDAYESDESIHTALSSGRSSPVRRRRSESEYSDDFTSAAESLPGSRRSSRQYSRRSSRESDDSYSYSDSYTSYTESGTELVRYEGVPRRAVETRDTEIQTGLDLGSLLYQWDPAAGTAVPGKDYGLGYVDPTPIASHVVSPDDLEALTGYSPSVLALNDMLRMQLQMTTQFLQSQRRIHESYLRLAAPDHKYTTLHDTKEYMKKHRKPTITFEEALKQVNEELGLDT